MKHEIPARIAGLMFIAAIAASACASDEPSTFEGPSFETTDSTATTTSPATTTPASTTTPALTTTTTSTSIPLPQPIRAATPPPASFAEVEGDYSAALESLLGVGQATNDQLIANDPEAIHARFDASLDATLPIEEMRKALDHYLGQAPLTGRRAERAIPTNGAAGQYAAELEWGQQIMDVTVAFNELSEIFSIDMEPQTPLPPDPTAGYESEISFQLPFEGFWYVFWGGDTRMQNHHVLNQAQRHAFDLLIWKDGATHTGDGTRNEDYWAYGQQLLAPAAGTVVTAIDGLPDQIPQQNSDPTNPAGNHVVIEVAPGEYAVMAHMQPGSLTVSEGDSVTRGQPIGLVGNSGNTSEPHIHMHLQDRPTFDPTATGLPMEFIDYIADGTAVEHGQPRAGQFIAAAAG